MENRATVNIKRIAKSSYSAAKFKVFVDGEEILILRNGECARFYVTEGEHYIVVTAGSDGFAHLTINCGLERETNLVCQPRSFNIELKEVSVDMSPQYNSPPPTEQSSGGGCLPVLLIVIGLFLLLLGLGFYFRLDVFFFIA